MTSSPPTSSVLITYNGEHVELEQPSSVQALLAARGENEAGLAIALNGAVLPRSRWDQPLRAGDVVDALRATQGG